MFCPRPGSRAKTPRYVISMATQYTGRHTLRVSGRSGGISVFCANSINEILVRDLTISDDVIESLCVSVKYDNAILYILAIYRPHSGTISDFSSRL